MQNKTYWAGWVSLLAALLVALDAVWFLRTHTTTGSPTLTLGLVTAFLGFSAAAFGITSYEKKNKRADDAK